MEESILLKIILKQNDKIEDQANKLEEFAKVNKELTNVVEEIKKRLAYYENSNTPPSYDSLYWKKQKKEQRSKNPSKPGQKKGHEGKTSFHKPTETIHHTAKKCACCGSHKIIQKCQKIRLITEIPDHV